MKFFYIIILIFISSCSSSPKYNLNTIEQNNYSKKIDTFNEYVHQLEMKNKMKPFPNINDI